MVVTATHKNLGLSGSIIIPGRQIMIPFLEILGFLDSGCLDFGFSESPIGIRKLNKFGNSAELV